MSDERMTPVVENWAGNNKPYRGSVDHGVPDTEEPTDITGWDNSTPVAYAEPKPEQTPIPVKVVSEKSNERRDFFTGNNVVTNQRTNIVGAHKGRKAVKVLNEDAANSIRIGDESVTSFTGYLLGPGKEISLTAETGIWAVAVTADCAVSWITEFSVEL